MTSDAEVGFLGRLNLCRRCVDFNKQLLFGEIGALIGIPLFPFIASFVTDEASVLSLLAVVGGLVTGSAFWLVAKIGDEWKQGRRSALRLAGQIAWFSPAAFCIGLMVYQPTLFLVARWLIRSGVTVVFAALASQALAFGLFLAAMNIYRLAVLRFAGERI